jgi:ABC-type sugar transport system ATPase subunit
VTLGVRPEDLRIVSAAESAGRPGGALTGHVVLVELLGGTSHVHFEVGPHRLMASVSTDTLPNVGETITVRVPSERAHVFGADDLALT